MHAKTVSRVIWIATWSSTLYSSCCSLVYRRITDYSQIAKGPITSLKSMYTLPNKVSVACKLGSFLCQLRMDVAPCESKQNHLNLIPIISNRILSNEIAHSSKTGFCIAIKAIKFNLKMESIINVITKNYRYSYTYQSTNYIVHSCWLWSYLGNQNRDRRLD